MANMLLELDKTESETPKVTPKWARVTLLLELAVVLYIMQNIDKVAFHVLQNAGLTSGAISTMQLYLIITSISLLAVIVMTYLSQKLRGERFSAYGLGADRLPSLKVLASIFALSLLLQLVCTFGIEKLAALVFHQAAKLPPVKSMQDLLFGITLSCIGGGLREELFYRAYLINKVSKLLGSASWGIWLASIFQILLFAQAHAYQGITGIIETGFCGILFTLVYLRSRSLWQAILFHTLFDIFGILGIYLGL